MYLRRQCYDKYWRCPGWAGGGWKHPRLSRCEGGSLLTPGMWNKEGTKALPEDRWWRWRWYRCRKDCGVVALPYMTRWIDPTWWAWRFKRWADRLRNWWNDRSFDDYLTSDRLRALFAWQPSGCPGADCLACEMGFSPPCSYAGPVPWRVRQAFNTTSGAYGNSSAPTFALNAFAILSDAISACSKFDANDPTKQTQEVVLTRALYVDFATLMQQKQSFLLTGKVSKGAAFGIGMDVMAGLEHNGVPVRWDGHVPASTGYLLNYDQMYLDLQPRYEFSKDSNAALTASGDDDGIFETEVRYNDGRMAVTVSATCPGQFRINPRYQGMLYAGA